MQKKGIILIVSLLVICILVFGMYRKKEQTVSNMATDTSNTIITGIWDKENIADYNYLVIPDKDHYVNTLNAGMTYPYSKITTIGEDAFLDNTYVKKIYISNNIKTIQKNAFRGCSSVEEILFGGTESEWNQINIEAGNDIFDNIKIKFNQKMPEVKD